MRKKRILLLSEGFGAGHTQAAHALSDALRHLYPGVQTRVIELGAFLHPTLMPFVFTAYRKTVTSQPKLIGFMYRSQHHKSFNRVAKLAIHRILYSHTANVIRKLKPDTIVCTHPFPNTVVSRLKRSGLTIPLVTVITDYDAHGTWVDPEVNKYLVSSRSVSDQLIKRGVSPSRIQITGIPVHPNFWSKHKKEDIRREYGLKAMPTVLIMGGGWGIMNETNYFSDIAKWADRIQLLFCMGSNDKTLQLLKENPLFLHQNIRLFGFTRNVDKLMDISDLLVTKPGGMTCTEGMAKRIPMLFYNPIPGQEEVNLQFFIDLGLGEEIVSVDTINRKFDELLHMYDSKQNSDSESAVQVPYNPQDCPQAIMELL